MTTIGRRGVMGLGLALLARPAAAHAPAFLAACADPDGRWRVAAFGLDGSPRFEQPIPARGHGAAVAPDGGTVVVFGRRPGTYALAIDAKTGRIIRRIARATDRWFSGHGVFSIDGSLLYATELDAEGNGVVGVYRSAGRFARIGEFPSGGTDPHDIRLSADGSLLLVANGGIRTVPNLPRARFDLDRIDSSLARLDPVSGGLRNLEHLDGGESLLSLRHLAVGDDGAVFVAMQHEGPAHEHPPLVAIDRGGTLAAVDDEQAVWRALDNYTGSAAASADGRLIAVTSPRGGVALVLDAGDGSVRARFASPDGSGVAAVPDGGFVLTSGLGGAFFAGRDGQQRRLPGGWVDRRRWDNHLVTLSGA